MNRPRKIVRKPEFYMLGGPKCGTTALATYLSAHQFIQVSQPKETNYFCKDLRVGAPPAASDEEYVAKFFPGIEVAESIAALDASVWHLYSEVAVDEILRFQPDARFLVMLRNPVDMAYSLHSMFHFMGQENVFDFSCAWALQQERGQGRSLPENRWIDERCFQYKSVCSLGSQLKRLYGKVESARVHLELQEDMQVDTRSVYIRVLDFMGVEDDGRTRFSETNAGHKLNNRLLVTALRSRPVLEAVSLIKRLTGLRSLRFGRPDLPMTPDIRRFLNGQFRDEILLMEDLLKRDLSRSWLPSQSRRVDAESARFGAN